MYKVLKLGNAKNKIKAVLWPDIIIKFGVYFSTFFSASVFVSIDFILLEIGRVYLDGASKGHVIGVTARVALVALDASVTSISLNDCHLASSDNSLLVTSVSGDVSSLLYGFRLMFPETSNEWEQG